MKNYVMTGAAVLSAFLFWVAEGRINRKQRKKWMQIRQGPYVLR